MLFPTTNIVEFNNVGVACLELGDFTGAIDFFRLALQQVQIIEETTNNFPQTVSTSSQWNNTPFSSSSSSCPPYDNNDIILANIHHWQLQQSTSFLSNNEEGHTNRMNSSSSSRQRRQMMNHHHHLELNVGGGPTTNSIIYTRALRLVIPSSQHRGVASQQYDDLMQDTRIVSSIIIFNLGLVCHLESLRQGGAGSGSDESRTTITGNNGPQLLQSAKLLYEQTLQLLDGRLSNSESSSSSSSSTGGTRNNALIDLLTMAIINNLIQINLECMEYDMADKLLTNMTLLVRIVQSSATTNTNTTYYSGTTTTTTTTGDDLSSSSFSTPRERQIVQTFLSNEMKSFLLRSKTSKIMTTRGVFLSHRLQSAPAA